MYFNIGNILDLKKTIAKDLFKDVADAWRVLPNISDFIIKLGDKLPKDKFEKIAKDIWIAKNTKINISAELNGPLIIDEGVEIRHCAYIRGKVIIGKNSVIGNSTELKNSILFDNVQVPHYNYVGDSILGYKAHLGAGSITSNVKSDRSIIKISYDGIKINTGLKKFGAIVGDYVEIGCNAVLNPGTIIGRKSTVYPLTSVRGIIQPNCICKTNNIIVKKEQRI